LTILISILTVLLILDCVLLIGIILLQRGKGQGLAGAFGAGAMEEALGAHAATTAQKITAILGCLFLALCVAIGLLKSQVAIPVSSAPMTETAKSAPAAPAKAETPAAPAPAAPAPAAPATGETK